MEASSPTSRCCCYPPHPNPTSIGPLYFIVFAQTHHDFRLADVHSAAHYHGIPYALIDAPCSAHVPPTPHTAGPPPILTPSASGVWQPDVTRAIMLAHLPNDEAAVRLASRVTSIRSIWAHWCSAETYAALAERAASPAVQPLWERFRTDPLSWKAAVRAVNHSISQERQRSIVESFAWMDFVGPIRLRDPHIVWGVWEEYMYAPPVPVHRQESADAPLDVGEACGQIWMGRRVCEGSAREWVPRLSLKERVYIGNTSMESEMSLIMASMALAGPGKVVYDPFAGTGSMLIAAAAMGAHVIGSDIDGRMMRGKKTGPNDKIGILRSAEQYGLGELLLDCAVFDMTQHPWRRGGLLDAIVADPPYGVRAGARRIGRRDEASHRTAPVRLPSGEWAHERPDWVPPTRPYHLQTLLADLLALSAFLLTQHGRLVFWMPIAFEPDGAEGDAEGAPPEERVDLPSSPDFELVASSLQSFGRWGRRLVTLRKVSPTTTDPHAWRTASHVYHDRLGAEAAPTPAPTVDAVGEATRRRATDDPDEFRNKYFNPRTAPASS